MPHVRTQMRKSAIRCLQAEFGDDLVGDVARRLRGFQKSDLPFIAVGVTDTITPTDNNPPGDRVDQRTFTIDVQACLHEDDTFALDLLDAIGTRIEKVMVDGSVLDVGPLTNWRQIGTSGPELVATDGGILLVSTTTYSASMFTADNDPSTNLHS